MQAELISCSYPSGIDFEEAEFASEDLDETVDTEVITDEGGLHLAYHC